MREETKQQVQEFYAGAARISGTVIAVVAAWLAISAIKDYLREEPFGGHLLGAVFLGLMAAVLITARAENPSKSQSKNQD